MERSPDQLVQYLIELEGIAEEVLTDKRQMVDLDRQRQSTRQAIRYAVKCSHCI